MIISLVEQHAEDAAFLWFRREGATRAPHHTLATLCDLDERLEAHLDGLRVAGETGAEIARAALAEDEPGPVFVAAALALTGGDLPAFARILDMASSDPKKIRELVSALGWIPWETLSTLIHGFFDPSCPPLLQRVGLAACAAHSRDPGPVVERCFYSSDPALRARAMRSAGELMRMQLGRDIRTEIGSPDEGCRFWASWASALFGDPKAVEALWPFAASGGPFADRAISLTMRLLDPPAAMGWLSALAARPETARLACIGGAALAEAQVIPWLLGATQVPALARIAAEGISSITGIAIRGPLAGKAPEGFTAGPNGDPRDERVAMDPDEHLPWPEVGALEVKCREAMATMPKGVRHFGGKPISPESLSAILRQGTQTRRASAALELLVKTRTGPLFEVRAPGKRQRAALG